MRSLTLTVFLDKSPRTLNGALVPALVLITKEKKINMKECFTAQKAVRVGHCEKSAGEDKFRVDTLGNT